MPPPTPNRPLKAPAAVAITASFRIRPLGIRRDTRAAMATADPILEPLRADPQRAAVLFDVDGTLAPIVDDPAAPSVPGRAADVLAELAGRYRLVACVTGRRGDRRAARWSGSTSSPTPATTGSSC